MRKFPVVRGPSSSTIVSAIITARRSAGRVADSVSLDKVTKSSCGTCVKKSQETKNRYSRTTGHAKREKKVRRKEGRKKKEKETFLVLIKREFVQSLKKVEESDCALAKYGLHIQIDSRKVEISLMQGRIQGISGVENILPTAAINTISH